MGTFSVKSVVILVAELALDLALPTAGCALVLTLITLANV